MYLFSLVTRSLLARLGEAKASLGEVAKGVSSGSQGMLSEIPRAWRRIGRGRLRARSVALILLMRAQLDSCSPWMEAVESHLIA